MGGPGGVYIAMEFGFPDVVGDGAGVEPGFLDGKTVDVVITCDCECFVPRVTQVPMAS